MDISKELVAQKFHIQYLLSLGIFILIILSDLLYTITLFTEIIAIFLVILVIHFILLLPGLNFTLIMCQIFNYTLENDLLLLISFVLSLPFLIFETFFLYSINILNQISIFFLHVAVLLLLIFIYKYINSFKSNTNDNF